MSTDATAKRTEPIDEAARRRFEAAWRNGQPQPLEQFLPADSDPSYEPTLVELVCVDMEFRWKAALKPSEGPRMAPCRVEAYLAQFPRLNRPEVLRRLLKEEYLCRCQHGDVPQFAEYQSRFPDLAISRLDLQPTLVPEAGLPPLPPPELPGYEILGLLGRGGMGMVYKAMQLSLRRVVAVKQILAGAGATAEELARFRIEAEAVAQLQHSNIVQVYEIGQAQGRPFIALEFVEGGTLDARIAGTPLPPRQAAQMAELLARAMHAVHQRGIVHRDLKPGNVLLSADGTPKITDFGLAKQFRADASASTLAGPAGGFTQSGAIVGTPCYMAPEQAAGRIKEVGFSADIYSLGAILYEMLTGRPPFKGESPTDTIFQVLHQDPVPPRRLQPKVPRDLETICLKCLEKEAPKRYASAGDLADDLHRFLDGQPIKARALGRVGRLWRWCKRKPALAALIAVLALTVVGAVAGLFVWQQARYDREQQALEFQHRQKQEALLHQNKMRQEALLHENKLREEALRHQSSLRSAVETNRKLARSELQSARELEIGRLSSAKKLLNEAREIAGAPGLEDLRGPVADEYDRVSRLLEFYQLSDRAERLAFLDDDTGSVALAEAALKRLGVFEHPTSWWSHLPDADLTPLQAKQLRKDVNHQLIVLAGIWTRAGYIGPPDDSSRQAFRRALEVLAMVRDFHHAQQLAAPLAGEMLEGICRAGLSPFASFKSLKGLQPVTASDCYFVGMAALWMLQGNDSVSKGLALFARFANLEMGEPAWAALRLLSRAAAEEPRHYWSQFWLGWAFRYVGNDRGAEMAFTTCVSLRPEFGLAYAERALVLARQFRGTDPISRRERSTLDIALFREDVLKRCLADVARAELLDPHYWYTHQVRLTTLILLERRDEAVEAAARMLAVIPALDVFAARRGGPSVSVVNQITAYLARLAGEDANDAEVWSLTALAQLLQRRDDLALASAARALAVPATHPRAAVIRARALAVRGTVALHRNDVVQAAADFREALIHDPGHFLAMAGRAWIEETRQEWDAALASYQALGKIAGADWQRVMADLGQARILCQLGRFDEARQALARAHELDIRRADEQAAALFPAT